MVVHIIPHNKDPRPVPRTSNGPTRPPPMTWDNFPSLPIQTRGNRTHYYNQGWPFTTFDRYPYLPLEIREMIIEQAMRSEGHFTDRDTKEQRWISVTMNPESVLPAICRVSDQTYIEALPVFVRNIVWQIRSAQSNRCLAKFLETVPGNKGFRAVRELRFTSFQHFKGVEISGPSMDLDLMLRCTGLIRVGFTMHVSKLMKRGPETSDFTYEPKSIREIVEEFDIERIFKSSSLKVITFDGISNAMYRADCEGDAHATLDELCDWIRAEFWTRNKMDVQVFVERWRDWGYNSRGW